MTKHQPCLQMNEIIRTIYDEDDVFALKEYMLMAMQLYYDGILQNLLRTVFGSIFATFQGKLFYAIMEAGKSQKIFPSFVY
ncbi:MAG: hypothetical protein N3D75_03855 [Candidatus Aenigmarchaeota archaeon]|nr:hypothetical protein [Candidatus Aenigmarchaeota archaeon]